MSISHRVVARFLEAAASPEAKAARKKVVDILKKSQSDIPNMKLSLTNGSRLGVHIGFGFHEGDGPFGEVAMSVGPDGQASFTCNKSLIRSIPVLRQDDGDPIEMVQNIVKWLVSAFKGEPMTAPEPKAKPKPAPAAKPAPAPDKPSLASIVEQVSHELGNYILSSRRKLEKLGVEIEDYRKKLTKNSVEWEFRVLTPNQYDHEFSGIEDERDRIRHDFERSAMTEIRALAEKAMAPFKAHLSQPLDIGYGDKDWIYVIASLKE